jgi:hypothetical protein
MAAYTPSLRLTLPVTGTDDGTWGDTVNNGITSLTDASIAGTATVVQGDVANYTLTNNSGATDQARNMFLNITGALTAARNVVCPAVSKLYFIKNSTTGGFAITLKTSGGSGISVPNGGTIMALYCDGTNVVDAITYANIPTINATTVDTTNLEVTNIKAKDGTASITLADTTGIATFSKATVVSTTDNTNAALRITQLGTGNALLVEDSTNPDASPFAIDANGIVVIGHTAAIPAYGFNNQFEVLGAVGYQLNAAFRADAFAPIFTIAHSRNATIGSHTVAQSGDEAGIIAFAGSDGTQFIRAAQISSSVDGTPGLNDMPGRLVFSTTADGAASPTERMRITAAGNVGIGTNAPGYPVDIQANASAFGWNIRGRAADSIAVGRFATNGDVETARIVVASDGTFTVSNTASNTERMRITNTGNVGIGTNAPGYPLHVSKDASGIGSWVANTNTSATAGSNAGYLGIASGTNNYFSLFQTVGGTTSFSNSGAGGTYIQTIQAQPLVFSTSTTERMRIDSAGNVGIGTSSPIAKLQTVSTGAYNGTVNSRTGLHLQATNITGGLANTRIQFSYDPATPKAYIEANVYGADYLAFGNGGGTAEAMRINATGNVGIGTITQTYQLQVKGLGQETANLTDAGNKGASLYLQANAINAGSGGAVLFGTVFGNNTPFAAIKGYVTDGSTNTVGDLCFSTRNAVADTALTERMRINAAGNVGIGTNTPGITKLNISSNVATQSTVLAISQLYTGLGTDAQWYNANNLTSTTLISKRTDGGLWLYQSGADYIATYTNGTERMRIDSAGNVGIGTSSPGKKLDVVGQFRVSGAAASGYALIEYGTSATSTNNWHAGSEGDGTFRWYNGSFGAGAERMRIDAAGNLGLGVTPSAWASSTDFIDIGTGTAIGNPGSGVTSWFLANAYFNGTNFIYKTTNAASYYAQNGTHIWYNAPSGTAGNAISFTQAMTLDASGNLGIGTSAPSAKLDVRALQNGVMFNVQESDSGNSRRIRFSNSGAVNTIESTTAIGTTSLAFAVDGSERARIDAAGNFLVGTTDAAVSTGVGIKTIPTGSIAIVGATGDYYSAYNSTAGAFRFYVNISGTISATNTTISAISDQRLKENVQDIDVGLNAIMALKPRKFDWKAGKGKDIKGDRGWIAQEFETVFPDMVDEWRDPAPEGEAPYKSVRADLIPVLTKAIQEQQALITALTARITALEAK